jgi:hypothetical protein
VNSELVSISTSWKWKRLRVLGFVQEAMTVDTECLETVDLELGEGGGLGTLSGQVSGCFASCF